MNREPVLVVVLSAPVKYGNGGATPVEAVGGGMT